MKKHSVILSVLISLSSFSFAQQKEKNYKWGCAVAINSIEAQFGKPEATAWGYANAYASEVMDRTDKSFSFSIVPKYFINNNFLLRFEFCFTYFNVEISSNSKNIIPALTNYSVQSATSEQKVYKYIGGMQYNFIKTKMLDSYCGLTASYNYYQAMSHNAQSEIRIYITDSLIISNSETGINPGGFSTGFGTFIGFNFYLHKHISFGTEFSSSLLYYNLGGVEVGELTSQNGIQSPVTSEYSNRSTSYIGLQFSKITSSFTIAFWF